MTTHLDRMISEWLYSMIFSAKSFKDTTLNSDLHSIGRYDFNESKYQLTSFLTPFFLITYIKTYSKEHKQLLLLLLLLLWHTYDYYQ